MAFLDLEGLKHLGQRLNAVFLRRDQLANNLTTTDAGLALDASQGKALKDAVDGKTAKVTGSGTFTTSGWTASGSNYVQTVTIEGVTSSSVLIVTAAPGSYRAYTESMIYCSAQDTNSLTFNAADKPTSALTVNVLILK